MKTSNLLLKSSLTLAVATTLLLSACSKTRDANSNTAATSASSTPAATAGSMTANAVDTWDSVKNYSYDQRAEFEAKAKAYAAEIDARTAAAKGDAKNRLAQARDDLRNATSELGNATAQTWDATKERVGRAWQQAESAYRNAAE